MELLFLALLVLLMATALGSGFPVAFAIGGAGLISFAIIAALDSAGLLIHYAIDNGSEAYNALIARGVHPDAISVFRYPDLPRIGDHNHRAGGGVWVSFHGLDGGIFPFRRPQSMADRRRHQPARRLLGS